MVSKPPSLFAAELVRPALANAFRKLHPRRMLANPVMFVITLVVCSGGYTALILALAPGVASDRADGSLVRTTERARATVAEFGADASRRLPADLAAASGSGLDRDISEAAARFQMERVAAARGVAVARVAEIIDTVAFSPSGPLAPERIVNVLDLNLALDRMQ